MLITAGNGRIKGLIIAITSLGAICYGMQPQELRSHVWASSVAAKPARQLEKLGRGLVAIHVEPGRVFVGWRMFATDPVSRKDAKGAKTQRRPGNEITALNFAINAFLFAAFHALRLCVKPPL